ncbi:MAG: DNA-3-methyladenine glycosylase I [Gammaproteobacteria bacterium]|nr:DNA-3-methyladenine glycosylase I [Gammaproteobacteria bacterium]
MVKKADPDIVDDWPRLAHIFAEIQTKNRSLYTDRVKSPSDWGLLDAHASDQALFEELSFQLFGAGFSRTVVRNRWPATREAFCEFDLAKVAAFDAERLEQLVANPALIRNRRKLAAVVTNATRVLEIIQAHGTLRAWLDSYPVAERYLLHREVARRFASIGERAAFWFLISSGYELFYSTDDTRRLLDRLGLLDQKERSRARLNQVMVGFSEASGAGLWAVSRDLHRFASGYRMKEPVCAERPRCPKCPLWDDCHFFNA